MHVSRGRPAKRQKIVRKSIRAPRTSCSRRRSPQKRIPGALGCAFNALLAPSWPLLATFWAPWAVAGPLWGPSGASRAPPGASQERPRAPPKRPESPESAQDRFLDDFSTFRIDFSSIFHRFFAAFSTVLSRSWRACGVPSKRLRAPYRPSKHVPLWSLGPPRDDLDDSLFDLSSMRTLQVHLVTN